VRYVQRALGIDENGDRKDKVEVKEELEREISKASPDSLRRALEVLRKKKSAGG
jgi:hypothetical protein